MKLVRQIAGDDCCGQACAAMLCGISLATAVYQMRSDGPARLRQIRRLLTAYGIGHGKIQWGAPGAAVDVALVLVRDKTHVRGELDGHWMVKDGARWLDPDHGVFRHFPSDCKCASHVVITRKAR